MLGTEDVPEDQGVLAVNNEPSHVYWQNKSKIQYKLFSSTVSSASKYTI